jgi:uncharacterized protein YecA (UPF0149 family)
MSAVCECHNPVVSTSEGGEKYCKKCGYWWAPEYGSRKYITPRIFIPANPKPNNFCPCGSGKKFKKCCMKEKA